MRKIILLLLIAFQVELSSGQTLTNAQVYDYMPGDVFQWKHTDIYDMGLPCYWPWITIYHTDSIISKYYSAASDTVFYSVKSSVYTPYHCDPGLPPAYSSGTSTKFYTDLSSQATHFSWNSCTPVSDTFFVSSAHCGKNAWESHSNGVCFEGTDWSSLFIEGCGGPYVNYRGGYGGEPHYTTELTYYKKGGVPCNTFSTVGINENRSTAKSRIYPNPNNGAMTFLYSFDAATIAKLFIYDIYGREVVNYALMPGLENQLSISEAKMSNGVYFYKMILDNEVKVSNQIIIIR